jgi:hypothetical protein
MTYASEDHGDPRVGCGFDHVIVCPRCLDVERSTNLGCVYPAGPMLTSKNFIFLASAALMISAGLTPHAHAQTGPADLPSDVMGLISRRVGCLEWSRKVSDPDRKTRLGDITSILRQLKCDEVANDEKALRQQYAGNPDILRALDANWVKVVKRLPVRIAAPPDPSR